jgi:hypothetical protein
MGGLGMKDRLIRAFWRGVNDGFQLAVDLVMAIPLVLYRFTTRKSNEQDDDLLSSKEERLGNPR